MYQLQLYKELTQKEFKAIARKIQYYCDIDNIGYLVVYSTTESTDAQPTFIRSGKPGRPRRIIQGTRTPPHAHICIYPINENETCYTTAQRIKQSIDKKYGRKVCRTIAISDIKHQVNFITYQKRQADTIRSKYTDNYLHKIYSMLETENTENTYI